ncbi:unnamed protein product [Merluccius merluccius]
METPECHSHKDYRRVPKSEMEKRRRHRINDSLETLRLLLLENTGNEKLSNPKVEKAEILESVVHFIKAEVKSHPAKRTRPWDSPDPEDGSSSSPPWKRPYGEGMRSCWRRVGEFISAKSQQVDADQDHDQDHSPAGSSPEGSPSSYFTPTSTPSGTPTVDLTLLSALLAAPRTRSPTGRDTSDHFAPDPKRAPLDPVWRPWPQ